MGLGGNSFGSSLALRFAVLLVVATREGRAQMGDCAILEAAELGTTAAQSTSGLLYSALSSVGQGGSPPIRLVDYNIVCLAQGSGRDLYRMVSVIATYIHKVNEPPAIGQFHFQCENGAWSTNVFSNLPNSLSRAAPVGNLTTPVRRDCRLCTDIIPNSAAEHCVACPNSCIGLMRCGGVDDNSSCCNFFDMSGTCMRSCPTNSSPNSNFECECNQGFMLNNTSCLDVDECSLTPCQNGGNCTDLMGGYSCNCATGYTGQNCSIDIDYCSSGPCQFGGTCNDIVEGYTCMCAIGYTGQNCSINIDECSQNPCQNQGMCTDLINDYSCECLPGYTNKNCSMNTDDCSPDACQNGGQCEDRTNGFICNCASGYTDQTCSTMIDPCANAQCMNSGTCIPLSNEDYSCSCVSGFTDLRCETDINECESVTCSNGGTCVNAIGSFFCQCGINWRGPTCEECSIANCLSCVGNNASCPECSIGYTPTPEGLCDACADRISDCLRCSTIETACLECTAGFKLEDKRCKLPCQTDNCRRCSDDGTACSECEDSFELDGTSNICNFRIRGSLSDTEVIGIIVSAIIFAIIVITLIACVMSWAYSNFERPKMTGQPKKTIFEDHGENRNPIFNEDNIIYENYTTEI